MRHYLRHLKTMPSCHTMPPCHTFCLTLLTIADKDLLMTQNLPAETLEVIDYDYHKIDLPKAIKLRNQGLSYREIGTYFKVTHQAVHQALKPLMPENNGANALKEHSLDLLRGKGYWLHQHLTEEQIKELTPKDKLVGIGIIHDKIHQEEAKSAPPAVNINLIGGDIDKLNIQINQLEQSIGISTDSTDDTSSNEEYS